MYRCCPRSLFKSYHRFPDEQPVLNNQTLTPTQIEEMRLAGVPISSQCQILNYDPQDYGDDVPIEHMRGIDMNDLYERSREVREKVRSPRKRLTDDDYEYQGKVVPKVESLNE